MLAPTSDQQIAFLTNLQRLLGEGSFVSTYKYCLLIALADLSIKHGQDDNSTLTLTTSQIAEEFVQYYWRQSAPFLSTDAGGQILRQNTGKQAEIVNLVHSTHNKFEGSLSEAKHSQREWNRLVANVSGIVDENPLWKLQTVGSDKLEFLYQNTGQGSQITLKPGIAFCFRKHYGMVADMVKGAWYRYVRRFNSAALGDKTDLNEFLFGSERANLNEVKLILEDFQSGECFYCHHTLKDDKAHVDHFIPWSRYPVDLGHNFVLTHVGCNGKKSDRLASSEHLEAWVGFQERNSKSLTTEFNRNGILNEFRSSLQIVNWAYTQTFENHGLTWYHNEELKVLLPEWSKVLGRLSN